MPPVGANDGAFEGRLGAGDGSFVGFNEGSNDVKSAGAKVGDSLGAADGASVDSDG